MACLLAAVAGQSFAQAESELEPSAAAARQRLSSFLEQAERADERLETIRDEESANGPYSPALVDQLQPLALLYQEIGEDDLAVESIERALQVERANFGLYSLDQLPLIRQLIEAERARGNAAAVAELEGRVVRLAYYHPYDPRSAEILRTAGDRSLEIYGLYLANALPPEINRNGRGIRPIAGRARRLGALILSQQHCSRPLPRGLSYARGSCRARGASC